MGIINVTPDSFYAGSRTKTADEVSRRVDEMISDGADIIDLGAYSSRPGADDVSADEELHRLAMGMEVIRQSTDIPVSIDTFRAQVARVAVDEFKADIINDISGGMLDNQMFSTVADLHVPYILMHMRGTPSTMQSLTDYSDCGGVTPAVLQSLAESVSSLRQSGVADIIVDPGFGFAKTVGQNYRLMADLPRFDTLGCPVLVGISRKSMLYKPLGISPDKSLDATTAANTIALIQGASILRVHDVRAAVQARTIVEMTIQASNTQS